MDNLLFALHLEKKENLINKNKKFRGNSLCIYVDIQLKFLIVYIINLLIFMINILKFINLLCF